MVLKSEFIKKLVVSFVLLVASCLAAEGYPVKPRVVGPVSQYGKLLAGRVNGAGHIYGACDGINAGAEIQLRGMSLYWSLVPEAVEFYSDKAISEMVRKMKVQVIRAAVAVDEDWGKGYAGYVLNPEQQRTLIRQVVDAAVANDIYVIIDWHTHNATKLLKESMDFFALMAKEYGQLDNVIFEIFNEPDEQSWAQIKSFSNIMISTIRKYSDNLILVPSPRWDQKPDAAIGNEVADTKNNFAYTFHFYSNSHTIEGEGASAIRALEAGLPLFVSEWGASDYDGKQPPNQKSIDVWQKFLDKNKISSLVWSASRVDEPVSAFLPKSSAEKLLLSGSGQAAKKILDGNPNRYKACKSR